jgi:Ca2+-transporting ATPase
LALATDPPRDDILNKKPDKPTDGLVNTSMKVMIFAESCVQVSILLTLQMFGSSWKRILPNRKVLRTLIFNSFIFLQLFNELNCRILGESTVNIFKGLARNPFFFIIWIFTLSLQILIIQFGGEAFSTVPISPTLWGISILLGFSSVIVGLLVRVIMKRVPQSTSTNDIAAAQERWQRAYRNVQRSRAFYNAIRRQHSLTTLAKRQGLDETV